MQFYDIKEKVIEKYIKLVFNAKQREKFYDKIYRLSNDDIGLQYYDIVSELLEQETSSGKKKTSLGLVYERILERLTLGSSISESLNGFIPEVDRLMIASFEDGEISEGFHALMLYNNQTKAMNGALLKALGYPSALISFVIGIIWYFSTSLIPQLTQNIPPGAELSTSSSMMIMLSEGFWVWFPTLLGSVIFLIIVLKWALPNYNGKFRVKLESFPPFNIYRIVNGCGFLSSLSALSKSGYQQLDALETMSEMATPYLSRRINLITEKMKEGENLGVALVAINLNFPDKEMLKDIALVSKYGALEDSLDSMVINMTEQGLSTIKAQSAVLKQIATFIVALTIAFLFTGIYSISQDMGAAAEQATNVR